MEYEEYIRQIAESISENKYDWVLVLGTGVSYDNMAETDAKFEEQIVHLQQEYETQKEGYDRRKEICQAVQERNYARIKKLLYGDVWNEVSFLYTEGLQRKARREAYAESCAVKEEMDLERCQNLDLHALLEMFPGIVLTTCQDETVEAFLEDEECISVENQIYTPDILTTLPFWEEWPDSTRILLKLYGTCKEPQFLLLSEDDMDMYYPENCDDLEELYTMKVLNQLFQTKNLLFIGMELPDGKEALNREPVLAPGIMNLLKKEVETYEKRPDQPQRYIILENAAQEEQWDDCQMTPVVCPKKDVPGLIHKLKELIDPPKEIPSTVTECVDKKEKPLDKKTAGSIFWSVYNRRSRHHVSKRERHILESHIWNAPDETDNVDYSKDEMKLLAMAANNYAEFGDLWKVMDEMETRDRENASSSKEEIIKDILRMRIDSNGQKLLQVLDFYGEGFPMGFLGLMFEDEAELKKWKKAGIQLTNSGIYIQSRKRKKIYEQIGYADSLMQTAGSRPGKRAFALRLQEQEHQMKDSYFYPMSIEIIKDKNEADVEKNYKTMFQRMIVILRDRSEGYSHVRSLLETELPAILGTIAKLKNYEEKPELLYYLFRECQMQPEDSELFLSELEKLYKGIPADTGNIRLLERKLMLCQVMAVIKSQDQNEERQKEAIKICEEAQNIIKRAESRLSGSGNLLHELIFMQQMQIFLLEGRINGKLASIQEIERCHEPDRQGRRYKKKCDAQRHYLDQMKKSLDQADSLKTRRTNSTGNAYELLGAEVEHQLGEYCFKQSQFCAENLKYRDSKETSKMKWFVRDERKSEETSYKDARKHYINALDFYRKYPEQYRLQEAGVLRNMADLYCRMFESKYYPSENYNLKCYRILEEAYLYYRSYNNLHGIADVLQSMGEMEGFEKQQPEKGRSRLCFYKAAARLYDILGDGWSNYVLSAFIGDARLDLAKK